MAYGHPSNNIRIGRFMPFPAANWLGVFESASPNATCNKSEDFLEEQPSQSSYDNSTKFVVQSVTAFYMEIFIG